MKYIVILGDGMADYTLPELDNKTPLQYANKPTIELLAKHGQLGMVKTVPEDLPAGSDVANLSVMGYDPYKYYSGRSPLEAASMGVPLAATDITFRCNLVTLSDDESYSDKTMIDYSSDEISTEEARALIQDVCEHLQTEMIKFYPGISYRHLMVWHEGPYSFKLTPPHDILDKKVSDHLPQGSQSDIILEMMVKSFDFLKDHPVNKARVERGLRPANSIWIWGEGKKPALSSFYDKYKLKGSVISAVDLIKGIGLCAELKSIDVEGATGNIHTNFSGKAQAAIEELKNGQDFVYVHIEAPDECGHRHEIENKVRAIELIDEKVVKLIKETMDASGEDYRILVVPDHPTPLSLRTHTHDAVPFLVYDSTSLQDNPSQTYDEACASESGLFIEEGYKLMDYFLK